MKSLTGQTFRAILVLGKSYPRSKAQERVSGQSCPIHATILLYQTGKLLKVWSFEGEMVKEKENEMKVVKTTAVVKEPFVHPLFTGSDVTLQVLLPESRELTVNVVNFGKGVRNKFHAHDSEQVLIVTAGEGIIATETEKQVITVGDVVLIPAGEKHWHGATEESELSHIYVTGRGSKVTQLED
jgi:quercetin dioxygenase-like cupin family protein